MRIELTQDQYDQLVKDSYLDIRISDAQALYFEYNTDMSFSYGEIRQKIQGRSSGYAFDENDLKKLIPTKPDDPSWHHNYPLCPNCGTYMIYNFEHCPKCGQTILWKDFTGDR